MYLVTTVSLEDNKDDGKLMFIPHRQGMRLALCSTLATITIILSI